MDGKNPATLYNTKLELHEEAKFLGITMDKGMHLKKHFLNILNETQHIKILLYRINNTIFKTPKRTLVYLYDCFIRSRIEYCPIMFLLADDQVNRKLEAEHRRFLKVIFQLSPSTKAAEVYKIAKTTSLEERIQKLAVNWFNKKNGRRTLWKVYINLQMLW